MLALRDLHKCHDNVEYEHVFTEEELLKIEKEAKEKNKTVQKVVREFAKTCTWEKIG